MYDKKAMEEMKGFSARVRNAIELKARSSSVNRSKLLPLDSIDRKTYASECNFTSNSMKLEGSRSWMIKMQSKV